VPSVDIDILLNRNAVASSIMTIDLAGSDHRSLLANISVAINQASPGDPTSAIWAKSPR
jgi:hypothetical protein